MVSPNKQQLIACFIGSNLVSLGAGTPYLYSFYAPQLLSRCHIPISQSSTLSFAMTLGSSAMGFLVGLVIDKVGPQLSCFLGTLSTFVAYYILYYCYKNALSQLYLISFALVLVGYGSVCGFYAAVKCCATNFPKHRGTAAAMPVALYALAGMLYSSFCKWYFDGNILNVFQFLMLGCSLMIFVGCFTLKIYENEKLAPTNTIQCQENRSNDGGARALSGNQGKNRSSVYEALVQQPASSANILSSSSSTTSKSTEPILIKSDRSESAIWSKELVGSLAFWGWGKVRDSPLSTPRSSFSFDPQQPTALLPSVEHNTFNVAGSANSGSIHIGGQEGNSLLEVQQQQTELNGNANHISVVTSPKTIQEVHDHSSTRDLPLFQILKSSKFICYYIILATLHGIGQMYIYSVGFIVATQLASHPDYNLNQESIQSLQVSIIALSSFLGRLCAGPLSDMLVKKFRAQRKWCIFLACMLTAWTSIYITHDNSMVHVDVGGSGMGTPEFVSRVSISSVLFGLAFGFTFGTYPATFADAFGTKGFSTIWGLATTGGLFTVKIFSSLFANDLDYNARLGANPDPGNGATNDVCRIGGGCYAHTFRITCIASFSAGLLTLIMIWTKFRIRLAKLRRFRERHSSV
ncbi:uncharacterized protein SCODWIG_02165 [Saccharomycodes ludwigii]|uniref:Nodulin-like domain-containing protein n=1 Tax=Saccharomycodes ludwigii TaxID=36035 RepID=A0A376B7F0_9ASCO|nr:hypothetical protein SCDLUD_002671 [Saccharomycodes ludwigii]KAH3901185.1 hypothetical protein SCDLUD_002671 [Saccharomycodes ludwigii]SSD60404.1 uncharacterized protein SCODWIG_02165 [Saccharomycodes ludwigii]